VIECSEAALENLVPMLYHLKSCGMLGHTVSIGIDEASYCFDGDGYDKIYKIKSNYKFPPPIPEQEALKKKINDMIDEMLKE
jgi:hypothetical protein